METLTKTKGYLTCVKESINQKKEKGVAGLDVWLQVISMLFVIGIIVMLFVLTAGELEDATDDVDAIDVINETGNALGEVSGWFDIIIVMSAVVVLVLLAVLVIRSIRGSGLMGGGA